ncbi:hypothetical protein [Prescottella agglutinans]|uniref:Molecular chaperone HscA n=1 Tax=Prescottella agglutinans TaxID=1644129 RepID=A0ABT6M884_9NOCA|nr:hypothetical protein [Prescottella agglutinans]MDH6280523.1 molecular chaperone HscA [Prescottella agglutinans]
MGGVLGISVGAEFVRLVRSRRAGAAGVSPTFERRTVAVAGRIPEEAAADAVGAALAELADSGAPVGVTVAYGDEAQAAALDAAMRTAGITDFRLIPEPIAVLERLGSDGRLAGVRTIVLYDLGRTGLTVSVVDRYTGSVTASERTDSLRCDRLEQLPRETFGSAVQSAIEESVELIGDLAAQVELLPEAVVLLGGGAYIPEIRAVLTQRSAVPIVMPEHPEFVVAGGAALLAAPVTKPRRSTRAAHRAVSRRQVSGAGLAGAALVVIAVTGFGLGYGKTVFGSEAGASTETSTSSVPSIGARSSQEVTTPPPPPPSEPPVTTTEVVQQPASDPGYRAVPPPTTAPPPAPLFPGLGIQLPALPALPQVQLPPMPVIPGIPLPKL